MLPCFSRSLLVDVWFGKPRRADVTRACAVLAFAGLVGGGKTALASEIPPIAVRITEELHDACPRAPTMLDRLRARLPSARQAAEGEPAVHLEVHVVQRANGTSHGTIVLASGGERAERTASSASCERVLAALAIMAAIGLEAGDVPLATPAEAPLESAPAPEAPASAPVPAPRSRGRTSRRQVPPPPLPTRSRFGIALGASAEVSSNRSVVVAPTFFGQLELPLRFAPMLRLGFARSFRTDAVSASGTVGLRWSEATLTACAGLIRQRTIHLGPCLNADAGLLEAIVIEPLPSRVRSAAWLSAGASARVAWRPLPAVSFELLGGARVPLTRNELLFEVPATLVYEAPPVVPFVGTAVVAHLP